MLTIPCYLISPITASFYWGLISVRKHVRNVQEYAHHHDDVIKWKHFPRYWPFVRGIHRSPVNSPHKGQWRGALIFSLICVWINGWVNNSEAGDLRRYCKLLNQWASYRWFVMVPMIPSVSQSPEFGDKFISLSDTFFIESLSNLHVCGLDPCVIVHAQGSHSTTYRFSQHRSGLSFIREVSDKHKRQQINQSSDIQPTTLQFHFT